MRARCERHGLALGPSGCLLCRRDQAPPDTDELAAAATPAQASLPAAGAVSLPADAAPTSAASGATVAAFAAAPTLAADPAPVAPATVTDAPQSRRLRIQIPPLALLLPLAAAVLYLFLSLLPAPPSGSAPPAEAAAAQAAIGAPGFDSRATERVPAAGTVDAADSVPGPPPPAARELPPAELVRLRERAQRAAARAQQLSDARARAKVVLYQTERCPHCSEAHAYFVAHGVHAEERDIDKDARARARYRKLNPRGSLPTIEVDGQVLAGFDPERLERALDRAGRARIRSGR
jgi:glutaredoxin